MTAAPATAPPLAPREHRARTGRLAHVVALAVVAWLVGAGQRAAWLDAHADDPGMRAGDTPLLATADAYYYATGVQRTAAGTRAAEERSPGPDDNVLVALGAGLVTAFGLTVEDVGLWLPVVLAPLVAVPVVLLGLALGQRAWGFLAALVAAVGFSYWGRTVPGYFDTDMVVVTFLVTVGALAVAALHRGRARLGTVAALVTLAAPWIHTGAERVVATMLAALALYTIIFARRDAVAWRVALALLAALAPLPWWVRAALIVALDVGWQPLAARLARVATPVTRSRLAWGAGLAVALGVMVLVALRPPSLGAVMASLGVARGELVPGLAFGDASASIAELVNPDAAALGARVAGHLALLASGLVGFALACWRFRPLVVLAPLAVLGVVVATGGQRYTIFAVPVVALGNMWLVVSAARWLAARLSFATARVRELGARAALGALVLAPAVAQAQALAPRRALEADEATLLKELRAVVRPGDYVLTWWDYAYGVWYFSGADTLVDGMKHDEDTWLLAELMFTRSQREAASLARLAVEAQAKAPRSAPVVDDLIGAWRDAGGALADFVPALRDGRAAVPAPTRQVFVYAPWRMLALAPTIAALRDVRGLVPAEEIGAGRFVVADALGDAAPGSGWVFDAANRVVRGREGEVVPVFGTTDVSRNADGSIARRETPLDPAGRVVVVNLHVAGTRLVMDRAMYDTVLSSLLVSLRADKARFEVVRYMRGGVVYRVRP